MKNKNGFISTSLVYTFFIIFLMLMIFLINSYSRVRFLLDEYKNDIKNTFAEASSADINVHIMIWDSKTEEYELMENLPSFGYVFQKSPVSYCKNGASISYVNGSISVSSVGKDTCYAYFREAEKDINLKMYIKENVNSNKILVSSIPNSNYILTNKSCTNGAILNFNEEERRFTITSSKKTVCEVEFTKKESDVLIHIYKEEDNGSYEYNGIYYNKTNERPGVNYTLDSFECTNKDIYTNIKDENGELIVESEGKNECNVYYNRGSNKVELIIMQETEEGVSGYTTGKKYSRTYGIPGLGYRYVGYICDNSDAKVTFINGVLEATSNVETVCRAYFELSSSNVFLQYYLETSSGGYERVSVVPSLGYVINIKKSKCDNGSKITARDNIPIVEALEEDICHIYYDMVNADIKVNVYVMNRESGKFELSRVPTVGYSLYNAGCTNGAEILYENGTLKVRSDSPTVCTVYFR